MAVPPWTRELFSGSLDDVAQKLKSAVAGSQLPQAALRSLDRVMRETTRGAQQLKRWARRFSSLSFAAINGSGVYFHEQLDAAPLAAEQLHQIIPGEYLSTRAQGRDRERIEQLCSGAVTARIQSSTLVAHSLDAAIVAAVATLPPDALIALRRCDSIRPEGGRTLPDLLASTGVRVVEIGTSDQVTADDWGSVRNWNRGPVVIVEIRWPAASLHNLNKQNERLTNVPSDLQNARRLTLSLHGTLRCVEGLEVDCQDVLDQETLQQSWLTIVPGHRLIGGPRSGLLLGQAENLQAVRSGSLWSVLQADVGTIAGLTYTLQQNGPAPFGLEKLLRLSPENLQDRAARLATQLAGDSTIASCEIVETHTRVAADLPPRIISRALKLRHQSLSASDWAERLAQESPGVVVETAADAVILDLRWIPPQLDEQLAGLLARPKAVAAE